MSQAQRNTAHVLAPISMGQIAGLAYGGSPTLLSAKRDFEHSHDG